ncbi:MAG: XdhC family protein [Clostridia bacterium]
MKELFQSMYNALCRGEDLVLCSIIASSGSTPRGNGAKMAVFADGSTLGTIGGGAVEHESIRHAGKAMHDKTTFTVGFNLAPNQTADIGMICGGQVVVYFQYMTGGDNGAIAMLAYIVSLYEQERDTWLITKIEEGAVRQMGVYDECAGVLFATDIQIETIKPLLKSRGVLHKGEVSYYVEPLTQAGLTYVFGGGHVAQELIPVIAHVGFRPVVYEDREAFADKALFPGAVRTITAPFTEVAENIKITDKDYVVIMTRGHQADYEVLEQALRTEAQYIGVIGSRHKIALTNKRLIESGIAQDELKRIHTPIGLQIKGETPAEIAISIAAELILCRAERNEGKQ